jgi:PilZ domain
MGLMSERRNARRYDLSLPILIRAVAAPGTAEIQRGKTRDVSTRGLYFVIDQDLRDGSDLDIMLTLPSEMTNGEEVLVKASGKVVRVEERLEDGSLRRGVAAVIERYDIMRGQAMA